MKHYAELSLIFGLPIFLKSKRLHNGRFKNLCARLQRETKKDLNKIIFPKAQIPEMTNKLEEFMREAGWYKSEKHIMTYLSFCLAMIENSEFKYNYRIIDTLNAIVAYLEEGGYMPQPCLWAGNIAAQKWEKIFKKNKPVNKKNRRYCPYCRKIVPFGYDFEEHKKLCKTVYKKIFIW